MKDYKSLMFVVLTVFLVSILSATRVSAFAGGDGSSGNPYKITNCVELQDMNTNLNANYVLVNDIDCSGTVNWNSGEGFLPIGNSSFPFTGSFDGQDHTISGLFIDWPLTIDWPSSPGCVGLFGWAGDTAVIKNVGLLDVDITGYLTEYVNPYSSTNVGGLVGVNYGTITNSYATGSATVGGYWWRCWSWVGGLVGDNYGNITNSYATCASSYGYIVGGLAGGNNGNILQSYANGSASSYGYFVGGLVGANGGNILQSYATGSVVSGSYYSIGGGLVGYNSGAITNSYSTGSVAGSGSVGGLVAYNFESAAITNSYWDTETSGQSTSAGGEGKTTAEMKTQSTYTNWDFVKIWAIKEGVSYPYLQWQIPYTLAGLQKLINTLPDAVLSDTIKNSLTSKVDNALKSVNKGNDGAAINMLNLFINQVEAQRGKKISEEAADMLIAYANNVISKIRTG